jgi:hypothetical protein
LPNQSQKYPALSSLGTVLVVGLERFRWLASNAWRRPGRAAPERCTARKLAWLGRVTGAAERFGGYRMGLGIGYYGGGGLSLIVLIVLILLLVHII